MNHLGCYAYTNDRSIMLCVWGGGGGCCTIVFNVPPIANAMWKRLLPYSIFQKTGQAKDDKDTHLR